ncbi:MULTISPECIES: glycosyltransferase family 4 protein [Colwellia]|uniref:Glycosyltransferase Gtf1 n=1 Tax=Colwellia marinimaniae TaxID=1513592 RepID=A0ABQ0MX87_9GAMM|nr:MULTISPECIES: glycosyltransferase family 4 protein [Colwellia]GAW96965.1 glycosyltransferase Gtf1 [Colwellia marinimaniae]
MSSNVDVFYIHLFNDFSGSPRVFRDAIDSEITKAESTYVFTSNHSGFLDGVRGKRITCFYARSNNRYIQLFYFLLSQILLFIQLSYSLIGCRIKGRTSTVVVNTMLPFGAGFAAKLLSTKVVYYVHETYVKPELLKRFLRFFIEHCATHVIFVSKYLKDKESFNKPISDVIYNGLRADFPIVDKVDSINKFENKELFFAGSLKAYKGIKELFHLAEYLPTFKVNAAINCEEAELDEFMSNKVIPKNLSIYARPSDIQWYFERSFLVLNLSLPDDCVETFGLSLLEGMAFGSPVVSPSVGGPVEFVNNRNGYLIDARETKKIAEFVLYLNSSFDIWNEYSKNAFETSKKFTASEYKISIQEYFKKYDLN